MMKDGEVTSRQISHNLELKAGLEKGEEIEWVMDYAEKRLEEIVDLNSGEKTMMNLWNQHISKYQVTQTRVEGGVLKNLPLSWGTKLSCNAGSRIHPLG